MAKESPTYPSGFKACLVCLCVSVVATGVLRIYLIWQNKRRDQEHGVVEDNRDEVDVAVGLSDQTDFELPQFRYVL